jgi:hypothetical protein
MNDITFSIIIFLLICAGVILFGITWAVMIKIIEWILKC